jgi:hypothetical protein
MMSLPFRVTLFSTNNVVAHVSIRVIKAHNYVYRVVLLKECVCSDLYVPLWQLVTEYSLSRAQLGAPVAM